MEWDGLTTRRAGYRVQKVLRPSGEDIYFVVLSFVVRVECAERSGEGQRRVREDQTGEGREDERRRGREKRDVRG